MALAQEKSYTVEDIEALPDGVRAELIDGQLFYMATPSRNHQQILMEISGDLAFYINTRAEIVRYIRLPSPFI